MRWSVRTAGATGRWRSRRCRSSPGLLGRAPPAGDRDLAGAGQGQAAGRNFAGYGGTSPDGCAVAHPDRGHQHGVAADLHVLPDLALVLVDPVVIGHDGSSADVGAWAHLGVADVGQVIGLGCAADATGLDLDEIADVHLVVELGART